MTTNSEYLDGSIRVARQRRDATLAGDVPAHLNPDHVLVYQHSLIASLCYERAMHQLQLDGWNAGAADRAAFRRRMGTE